jgi:hypothetical protein
MDILATHQELATVNIPPQNQKVPIIKPTRCTDFSNLFLE